MITAPTPVTRPARANKASKGQAAGTGADAAAVIAHVKALGLSARAGLQRTLSEAQVNMREFAEKAGLQDNAAKAASEPLIPVPQVGRKTRLKGLAVRDEQVLTLISQAVEEYAAADHATTSFQGILRQRLKAAGYNASAPLVDGRV